MQYYKEEGVTQYHANSSASLPPSMYVTWPEVKISPPEIKRVHLWKTSVLFTRCQSYHDITALYTMAVSAILQSVT